MTGAYSQREAVLLKNTMGMENGLSFLVLSAQADRFVYCCFLKPIHWPINGEGVWEKKTARLLEVLNPSEELLADIGCKQHYMYRYYLTRICTRKQGINKILVIKTAVFPGKVLD